MIRPLTMSNNICFRAKTIEGGENKSLPKPTPDFFTEARDPHERKQDIKNSLCVGALCGAILAGASVSMYKDHQIKDLLNDMNEEIGFENFDSLKIEDATKDSVPDIVVIDNSGNETVYDLTSGSIYYKDGYELVEKHK